MRYGRAVPDGYLPVFSVGSVEEAKRLLTLACPLNYENDFVAPELAETQDFKHIERFAARLEKVHKQYLANTPACRCKPERRAALRRRR